MNKRLGIVAETACRRILEGRGVLCIRASASHGICDVIALGEGEVGLIEVKATAGAKYSAAKTNGVKRKLLELQAAADRCDGLAVVAVFFARLDEFRYFTIARVLRGPVGPLDADLDLDNGLASIAVCPKDSSPSVGFPLPKGLSTANAVPIMRPLSLDDEARYLAARIREATDEV